jgi:hypothetical protein
MLLGADPAAVAIRNLKAEAEGLPRSDLPDTFSLMLNHPSILGARIKDESEYDKDVRRAHFMERAQEAGFDTGTTEGQIRALRSPYAEYGEDWPIHNATRWFSSFPGAVYAAGQMLANKVDPEATPYPNAYRDFAKNVNNIAIFAEPMGKNLNHMRDMEDMRSAAQSLPVDAPLAAKEFIRGVYAAKAAPKTGREMLEEAKAEELIGRTGTRVLGGTMDATFDPFFLAGPSKTMHAFLMDYGLGSMHETLPVAAEGVRAAKEYFRPSDAMYY